MNLIIATGIYPPDIGGPATYSKKIAEEFSKRGWNVIVITYADIDISPFVKGGLRGIFRSSEVEKLECSNGESFALGKIPTGPPLRRGGKFNVVKISRAHNVFARYFLYTWELVKLARNADLIYAQGPVSEGVPALIASKLTGKKYVLKVVGDPAWERMRDTNIPCILAGRRMRANDTNNANRGKDRNLEIKKLRNWEIGKFVDLEKFQGMKWPPLKTNILRWIQQFVAKNAVKIIVPSQYLKKIVMMWGVDADKIKVVYNAARERIMNYELRIMNGGDEEEHNEQISKVEEGDIILSVGRLVAWKGFDVLIGIMPELWKVNQNFKLVIVGDGPEYERLKEKIRSVILSEAERSREISFTYNYKKDPSATLGMTTANIVGMPEDKIILTGKIEHNELMQLMRKAKMFVLNSGYEGLSHSVIEAMQAGIPCAVSNVGGNPELVENEKTGLLFEYNNEKEIKKAITRLWQDNALREQVAAGAEEKVKEFGFERMMGETEKILNFK